MAWILYPAENHFSFLTSTIFFLGSPDAHKNPDGWRYSQIGGSAGRRWLILHATLAGITTTGMTLVGIWRWKCASDPTLRTFPGEGIFSLPLWEWITFFGFGLFLALSQAPRRNFWTSSWSPAIKNNRQPGQF